MVGPEGAVAGAADQNAGPDDGKHHALLTGKHACDPLGRHLFAIGMRDRAGHARDVVVAGEQSEPRRIPKHRRTQEEPWCSDGHGQIYTREPARVMEKSPAKSSSALPRRRRGPSAWSRTGPRLH